jgi:hypothetical protein
MTELTISRREGAHELSGNRDAIQPEVYTVGQAGHPDLKVAVTMSRTAAASLHSSGHDPREVLREKARQTIVENIDELRALDTGSGATVLLYTTDLREWLP